MVLRRVGVMNGSSSKGLYENLCARHHWTSRRQSLEVALRQNRGEPCTSPAVKHWRRKTVRRRMRRRRSNNSHLIYIQSENRRHSYRGTLYLMWQSNFLFVCLSSQQRNTFKRIALLVGRISLLSMPRSHYKLIQRLRYNLSAYMTI